MSKQMIMVSSITYAMKAKSLLKNYNIYVDIIKTSKHTAQNGCGYSLIVNKDLDKVIEILKKNNIKIIGVVNGGEKNDLS